ncbi:unnamed protein product [Prorocentrum cordatum]|uniref:Nicotinamide phosphoribosyltransferase n=1 Tax=Prorocentrum cordatum TaxID=2364126 RepID=A0ABN9RUI1_9DINO|nr:unnamed protein product [Polarella glacialis]
MADLQNILEEFKAFDKTGDGLISREEFTSLLHHLDKGAWPAEDVDALLDSSHLARGSQKVPYVELFTWFFSSQSEDTFNNIVILTDSYKVTHHLQYPPGTEKVYSYFECRGGQFPEVCFFGLQYHIKKYMTGPVVTMDKIDAAEEYFKIHFSHPKWDYNDTLFNRQAWEYIATHHASGVHLVNCMSTDTMAALIMLKEFYALARLATGHKCTMTSHSSATDASSSASGDAGNDRADTNADLGAKQGLKLWDLIGRMLPWSVVYQLCQFSKILGSLQHEMRPIGISGRLVMLSEAFVNNKNVVPFALTSSRPLLQFLKIPLKYPKCPHHLPPLTLLRALHEPSRRREDVAHRRWSQSHLEGVPMTDLQKCLAAATAKAAEARGKVEEGRKDEPGTQAGPGAPDAKSRRTADGGGQPDEVNAMFLRDYLNFKASARPALAAKQIVFLLKSNANAAAFRAMTQTDIDQKPEITEEMRKQTLKQLATTPAAQIKFWVGEFTSRYSKPLTDRTWKWTLTFTDVTPDAFLEAFAKIMAWKDPTNGIVLESWHTFQRPEFFDCYFSMEWSTFAQMGQMLLWCEFPFGAWPTLSIFSDSNFVNNLQDVTEYFIFDGTRDTLDGGYGACSEVDFLFDSIIIFVEGSESYTIFYTGLGFLRGFLAAAPALCDIFKACTDYWGTELKATIEKSGGVLVVRPDSGELPGIVLQVFEKLESKFVSTQTETGHKLLPPCICVIQGDGVDIKSVEMVLEAMRKDRWAADSLAFGSGGALLQKMHRDTQKCAFKCSYALIKGKNADAVKNPITDPGKKSKKGRLTLELRDGVWTTATEGKDDPKVDQLVEVFKDGRLLVDDTLIRNPGDAFNNIVLLTDSYKVTHHLQHPPGTEKIYSYFECRGGQFPEVCFFGLQYYLKKYMVGPVVTPEAVNDAEEYFKIHFAHPVWGYDSKLFNREAWEYILKQHGKHLPVVIKAVPEGTVLPYKNVPFTLENTDTKCFWLANYLETLLVQVWYAMTVCTQSRDMKKIIMAAGTCSKCMHDFGFRGVSSVESVATGGGAHLVNFLGTDTMAALVMLRKFNGEPCGGFSIPASEHSTMTSWGREGEVSAMRNMLEMSPTGLVECVSDSYDIFKACTDYWGTELKTTIEKRDGVLVVRPDSGKFPGIVLQVLEKLKTKFGSTTTSTGHRVMPDCIRVVQGDGADIKSLEVVLQAMKDKKWAADNLAFGSGGALLQKMHGDTQKCAFKCSYALIKGQDVDVVKDPITEPGKKFKNGKLTLELNGGQWTTVTEGKGNPSLDKLVEVFRDGNLLVDDTFAAIRERAKVPA